MLEETLESPLDCKKIQPVHPKGNQSWIFIGRTDAKAETPNTLATWCKALPHWKIPWGWEWLKAGGEGDNRGWDGWMAPPTQWTWVWISSGSLWWTGKPGLLQSMGWQRVGHDWTTELTNWTNIQRRFSSNLTWFLLDHRKGVNTSQLNVWGQYYRETIGDKGIRRKEKIKITTN